MADDAKKQVPVIETEEDEEGSSSDSSAKRRASDPNIMSAYMFKKDNLDINSKRMSVDFASG